MLAPAARRAMQYEALALVTRLEQAKPFSMRLPMVAAAAPSPSAMKAMEGHMRLVRRTVRDLTRRYLARLDTGDAAAMRPEQAYRGLTVVRLRLHTALSQFDMFADVLTQRGEHEYGLWLAGLDHLAEDSLRLRGTFYDAPPVVTYLDRGIGAAIRRARTRLPGGRTNPVAIIRVPRERMVGAGIASSLVHEAGHQGAALLGLVESLRAPLRALQANRGREAVAWSLWERWVSEIVADFWSVAQIGVGSTVGLQSVVSLPRAFVFRIATDDPHPVPWVRVMLSLALGELLYPDPQWRRQRALWQSYYPLQGLDARRRRLLTLLLETMPDFVALLAQHRPPSLQGQALRAVFDIEERQPARLRALYQDLSSSPEQWAGLRPTLAFAVIGQARVDGRISPGREAALIDELLSVWAGQRAQGAGSCGCKTPRRLAHSV